MAAELYHQAIVEAAAAAVAAGRLSEPAGTATVDNPLCGDRVSFDVALDDDRVEAVAHRVRGCLLCEATASVIGANAPGAKIEELTAVKRRVDELLGGAEPGFPAHWRTLEMFTPVRDYKSRHECVTLAFDALEAALGAAGRSRSQC